MRNLPTMQYIKTHHSLPRNTLSQTPRKPPICKPILHQIGHTWTQHLKNQTGMYPIRSLYIEVINHAHDMLSIVWTLQGIYLLMSSIAIVLRHADLNSDIPPFSEHNYLLAGCSILGKLSMSG